MTATREADLHRPNDRGTLRAAAYELHSRGLTPRDIAVCLRLSERAVRSLLAQVEQQS
jgi:DNA-binding CsgD family transcriptional regulator